MGDVPSPRPLLPSVAAACLITLSAGASAQNPQQDPLTFKLVDIPAPVQTAIARDVAASGAFDLADFMNRRFTGVHVNQVQGNHFSPTSTTAATPRRRCSARRKVSPSTWTVCG